MTTVQELVDRKHAYAEAARLAFLRNDTAEHERLIGLMRQTRNEIWAIDPPSATA